MRTKMIVLSLLVVAGFSVSLRAQSWSAYGQFDVAVPGGSGVWQYGYYETSMSHFWYNAIFDGTVWGGPSTNIIHGLAATDGDSRGSIHCNFGEAISKPGFPNGMYWNAYSVTMQIGPTACIPALRFNVPVSGTYQVHAVFEHNTTNAGLTTDVGIMVNGSVVDSGQISGFQSGPENFFTYDQTLNLSAGSYVEAVVLPNSGIWRRVAVVFEVTVGSLPEPTMDLVMELDAGIGTKDPNKPDGISYGETVRIWEDQSASGILDATTQWGSPTLESGTFPNGPHNVVRFTGDDGMTIYKPSSSDPNFVAPLDLSTYTIYVVGKLNTTLNASQVFLANYAAGRGYSFGVSEALPDYVKLWTNGGEIRSSGPIDDTSRYYLMAGTVTQSWAKKLFVNDCLEAEGNGGSTYTDDSIASVGALGTGTQFLKGDIAEIRVYNGFIEATHTTIVNELSTKYGLNRECLGGPNPDQVVLSALTFFGTTSAGMVRPEERWNTLWQDGAWDIALANGTVADLTAISDPNNFPVLNVYDNMNIYVIMQKGQEYTFSWANARPANAANLYYGMNFFFDSAEKLSRPHGISVYANMYDVADTEQPEFLADSVTTMGWPITDVPGAGTLIYKNFDKGLAVTLTDWVTYHDEVFGVDLITRQNIYGGNTHPLSGPDGENDQLGQFTLRVDPYAATCDDLLALGDEYLFMDFNKDCYVNLEDFAQFAMDWLKCNDPANSGCTD